MKIFYYRPDSQGNPEEVFVEAERLKELVAKDDRGRIWLEYLDDVWRTRGFGRPREVWGQDGINAVRVEE